MVATTGSCKTLVRPGLIKEMRDRLNYNGYAIKEVTLEKCRTMSYKIEERDGYFPKIMTNHKNPATHLTTWL